MNSNVHRKETDRDLVRRTEAHAIEVEAALVTVIETEREAVKDDQDIAEVDHERESIIEAIEIETEKTNTDPLDMNQGMRHTVAQETIDEKKLLKNYHKTRESQLLE